MTIAKQIYPPEALLAYNYINQVNEINHTLFDRYPLDFFRYGRSFYDGSWYYFTSHQGISQYLFDSGFTFLPHVAIKKARNFFLFSSIEKFQKYTGIVKENFQIDNIFAYTEKYENYIDIFFFGAHSKREGVIDFYLNNLDLLKNYSLYFKNKAQDLIKVAEKNKIIVPKNLVDSYYQAYQKIKIIDSYDNSSDACFNEFSLISYLEQNKISITPREMDCLRLLTNGFTAKLIAKHLRLSQRTVESYLENIKEKFNCRSRIQLIELLFKTQK